MTNKKIVNAAKSAEAWKDACLCMFQCSKGIKNSEPKQNPLYITP